MLTTVFSCNPLEGAASSFTAETFYRMHQTGDSIVRSACMQKGFVRTGGGDSSSQLEPFLKLSFHEMLAQILSQKSVDCRVTEQPQL